MNAVPPPQSLIEGDLPAPNFVWKKKWMCDSAAASVVFSSKEQSRTQSQDSVPFDISSWFSLAKPASESLPICNDLENRMLEMWWTLGQAHNG